MEGNDKISTMSCASARDSRKSLNDLLQFARGLQVLPTPKGEDIIIITGAGGSGVLLSDACVDNDLSLMKMPPDLDAAFRKFIPPFGAAGNPVDITGGEPPTTYANTIRSPAEPRIHALILVMEPHQRRDGVSKLCAEVVERRAPEHRKRWLLVVGDLKWKSLRLSLRARHRCYPSQRI